MWIAAVVGRTSEHFMTRRAAAGICVPGYNGDDEFDSWAAACTRNVHKTARPSFGGVEKG